MYSSRSGANVCSTTAVRTRGCQRQDWTLAEERETGVHATLAGIHDRELVSWHVHDFGLQFCCLAGTSGIAGANGHWESRPAALSCRSRHGSDGDTADLLASGTAIRSTHESGDHADLFPAPQAPEIGGRVLLGCPLYGRRGGHLVGIRSVGTKFSAQKCELRDY